MSQKLTLSSVSSRGPPLKSHPIHYSMHTRAHTHTQTQAHTHTNSSMHANPCTHTHKPRHTHTNSSMHANPCTHTHTNPGTHTQTQACMQTHAHTHTNPGTHTQTQACMQTHVHAHTHTQTQAHTHTHTHTNSMHTLRQQMSTNGANYLWMFFHNNRCLPMELTISGCSFTTTEMSQITPYSHQPPPPSYPNTHIIFLTAVHSLMPTPPHPYFITTVWVSQMLIPSRCLGLGCVTIP